MCKSKTGLILTLWDKCSCSPILSSGAVEQLSSHAEDYSTAHRNKVGWRLS